MFLPYPYYVWCSENGQTHLKNLAGFAARFLTCFEHFVNTWHYKVHYPSILTENENKKRIFYIRPMQETPDQNKAESHFLQRKQSHLFLLFFKVFELILTMKISD